MTVTIRSVHAFAIRSDLVGGQAVTPARRPAWTADAKVAGPISVYPRYKRLRAAWRPTWPGVGCLNTASDGGWGFGVSRYGAPVIDIINGHLGPLLEGEPATATERLWDMMAHTRELISPGVELMLDCWMALDVEYTARLAERLRPYGLRWIEDCLHPDDHTGRDTLRARLPGKGLATGEHCYSLQSFARAAARRSVDMLQPDIGWAGGLTACIRIAHMAEPAGITVIPHAGLNTPYGQHFAYALPAGKGWGEFFLGTPPGVPLKETRLFPGMAMPQEGRLVPNGEPGFGLGGTLDDIKAMRA